MPRPQIVIENPILNTPYAAPARHFRFDDEGITDEIVEGRRPSSCFMPIPKAKKKGGQLVFDEWTGDRIEENAEGNRWSARPKTILVDSTQLDSGEAMSAEFKAAAATEIEEFKAEIRQRFPGRDVDDISDEDLLREVMNTVGQAGEARRGCALRRVGVDAHRGLGREHGHPRPRRPGVRHPAAL